MVWEGVSTTFVYASTEAPQYFGQMPTLPDGSVMIFLTFDGLEFVDRLTPDGRVHRMEVPPVGSVLGSGSVDQNGFLRLGVNQSQWNLVHYDLP